MLGSVSQYQRKGVTVMTGWEFYSVNFSVMFTLVASVIMLLSVMIGRKIGDHFSHVDTMAGDEGED